MRTFPFSIDIPEWTRYHHSIEVPDGTSYEQAKRLALAAWVAGETRENGNRLLGRVDFVDDEVVWPEPRGWEPQGLCVDGCSEDFDGPLSGDGNFPPFYVFDIDAQTNIAGPFPTRNMAEKALALIMRSRV